MGFGRRWLSSLMAAIVAGSLGCGDDGMAPATDAGPGDGGPPIDVPEIPEAAEAELPSLTCPVGWTEFNGATATHVCAPAFVDEVQSCTGPTMRRHDGTDCRPVGTTCEAALPSFVGQRWFVDAAAAPGGDGSEAFPFDSVGAAVAASTTGDEIVLEPGTHGLTDTLELTDRSLRGRCASSTTLEGSPSLPLVLVDGAVTLANLTLRGGSSSVVVANTGQLALRESALLDPAANGILAEGTVVVEASLLRATEASVEGRAGIVFERSLEVVDSTVEGFIDEQILGRGATARGSVTGSTISAVGVSELEISGGGVGIRARDGAIIEIRSTFVFNLEDAGIEARGDGSVVDVESSTVAFIAADTGTAVSARDGGTARVRNSTLIGAAALALALNDRSVLVLSDSVLEDASNLLGDIGVGVFVADFARAEIDRVASSYSSRHELRAERGSELTVTDFTAASTFNDDPDTRTSGVLVQSGASMQVTRVTVLDASEVGVHVGGGTLMGTDVYVEQSAFNPITGYGAAIEAETDGLTDLERVSIRGASYIGVIAEEAAEMRLRDLWIDLVLPSSCVDRRCPEFLGGIGLGAYDEAVVDVERFAVERAQLIGIQLGRTETSEAQLDLRVGTVVRSQVGLNVQAPDYDFDRLLDRVVLEDNERNVDSAVLPAPAM